MRGRKDTSDWKTSSLIAKDIRQAPLLDEDIKPTPRRRFSSSKTKSKKYSIRLTFTFFSRPTFWTWTRYYSSEVARDQAYNIHLANQKKRGYLTLVERVTES